MTAQTMLPSGDLAALLTDLPDTPEQVWACAVLGLDGTEDWYEGRVDSRQFARYDLASVLVALEDLSGVIDRIVFCNTTGRGQIRHRDVAVGYRRTRRCAEPGTRVALKVGDKPVILWVEVEPGVEGVYVYAASPHNAAIDDALNLVSEHVAGAASTWRGQAVLISPSETGLFTHLPPDDVTGLVLDDTLDAELTTNLVTPVLHYDELRELVPRRGVLLYGPPGTGKTSAARVLRARCGSDTTVLVATPKALTHPEMVRIMYQMAAEAAPSIVVIEDLDVTIGDRHKTRAPEALGEMLAQMDGPGRRDGVFTIATTNHIDALDAALARRPGRFDRRVYVGPAPEPVRRSVLSAILDRYRTEAALDDLVDLTDGWTFAQIAELERLAVLQAKSTGADVDLEQAARDMGAAPSTDTRITAAAYL